MRELIKQQDNPYDKVRKNLNKCIELPTIEKREKPNPLRFIVPRPKSMSCLEKPPKNMIHSPCEIKLELPLKEPKRLLTSKQ